MNDEHHHHLFNLLANLDITEARGILTELLAAHSGRRATSVHFAVPRFITEEGTIMPESITIPAGTRSATVPLIFKDGAGIVCAPPPGGSISSSSPAVATAVLASDDSDVVVTRVTSTAGTCILDYTNGAISEVLAVTCVADADVATSMAFDTANAKFALE